MAARVDQGISGIPRSEVTSPATRTRSWSTAFLALSATVLLTVLGHWLAGATRRGAVWFCVVLLIGVALLASLVFRVLVPASVVLGPLFLMASLLVYVDAFRAGLRSRRTSESRSMKVFGGVVCLVLAAGLRLPERGAAWLRQSFVESYALSGRSMMPTLQPGDLFLVTKRMGLQRWDVVVYQHPQLGPGPNAGRLVGMPGEKIEISPQGVLIDGVPHPSPTGIGPYRGCRYFGLVDQSLAGEPGAGYEGHPVVLGHDEFFVLGDNVGLALDGRVWETPVEGHQIGALPANHILGRATMVYWPAGRWRLFR